MRSELGLPDPDAIRALLRRMVATGTSLVRTHTDVDPEVGLDGIQRVREAAEQFEPVVRVQQVAFPAARPAFSPGTADLLRAAVGEGATAIGGLDPTADGDVVAYVDLIFDIADRGGTQVDLHLHSHGDVGMAEIDMVIERTKTLGMQGRVAVSHAYCFGDFDDTQVRDTSDRLAGAGVGVVIAAPYSFPIPPIRTLVAAGVTVACGHDGISDLWGLYGTGDMLDRVRHIASRSGFRRDTGIQLVLQAATSGGRRLITQQPGGIVEGEPADFLLVPASCPAEAVVTAPLQRTIVRGSLA